jgi:hypothetical protein
MAVQPYKTRSLDSVLRDLRLNRGTVFGVIIITALLAFEIFNYSTTEYAFSDLLGDLKFLDLRWSTILAIAFCGIDFAGIARLFTPNIDTQGRDESWYLFGAWMLAACMNAMLTWWGVSLAILSHPPQGSDVMPRETILRVVPIFVALLVWLIRVLIIGTFSVAGDRLFSMNSDNTRIPKRATPAPTSIPVHRPATQNMISRNPIPAGNFTSATRSTLPRAPSSPQRPARSVYIEPTEPKEPPAEPTYEPIAALPTGRPAPSAPQEGPLTHAPIPRRRL